MENEKELLAKDLPKLKETKDVKGLEQFSEDAKLYGYEDLAQEAQELISKINSEVVNAESYIEIQIPKVEEMGGTPEELNKRVNPIQKEIEQTTKEAEEEIGQVVKDVNENKEEIKVENIHMNVKKALETAEEFFLVLQKDIIESKNAIDLVEAMEGGSREKYDAAFKLRDKIEEKDFDTKIDLARWNLDIRSSSDEGKEKLKLANKKLVSLKRECKETLENMMIVWWNAKAEYEGGRFVEIAKNYKEIIKTDFTLERAELILSSKNLDDGGKEYLATELMKKFIYLERYKDAVSVAVFAKENRFYKTMGIDGLSSDLATKLKHKDTTLYEKIKSILGPNTKPHV